MNAPHGNGTIAMIVACSENRVIGVDGHLPWDIPMDWNYYLETIKDGVLVMGRRCYEDMIKVKELQGNHHFIVVTRSTALASENTTVVSSLPNALTVACTMKKPVWVCGGQRIYEEAMSHADLLHLTLVHTTVEGDTWFPDWRHRFTEVVSKREAEDAGYKLTFLVLAPRHNNKPGCSSIKE